MNLDSRYVSYTRKKSWTLEIAITENFGPKKYPWENVWTHKHMIAPWHETHKTHEI